MPTSPPLPAFAQWILREIGAAVDAPLSTLALPPGSEFPFHPAGMLGALPCWWTPEAGSTTRPHAQALGRRGQLALVLCGSAADHLDLLVTMPPAHSFRVGQSAIPSLRVTRLRRMATTGTRIGDALNALEALDLDARGRATFRTIRASMQRSELHLEGSSDPSERQAWLLLQVTRLLFLRFVESEGWLDGSVTFLHDLLNDGLSRKEELGRTILAPLFFGTLNLPPARRGARARQFGAIPFLNGGLFEPHPLERAHCWRLPPHAWQELLDALIHRTEVSLDSAAHPDAISPEMLGRILEGLMDPEERSRGGVFYTPPALVERMVRETFACHLAPQLGRSENHLVEAFDAPDPPLLEALRRVRVLDPAVGSGAFLVGALSMMQGSMMPPPALTRHLLTHNLYGIDRNPTAVRITELRLWLELLRCMRGMAVQKVDPLPNLDAAIRAGDAIVDPLTGRRIPRRLIATVERARRAVEKARGPAHHTAQRRLLAAEQNAIDEALRLELSRLEHLRAEHQDVASTPTLLGEASPPSQPLASLSREIEEVRSLRRDLERNGRGAAFAIEGAWPQIVADGGFDLIVGNPPWVRAAELPESFRHRLAARYRWWQGHGKGWSHPPDLAVAFVERSFTLLRPAGTLGLLLPGKLATTGYASRMRAALVRESTLHVVADLTDDPDANFAATTYPLALVATRKRPAPAHRVRRRLARPADTIPQSAWADAPSWAGRDQHTAHLLTHLATEHPTVSDHHTPSIGVKTGANELFLDPPPALAAWTRPAIRGRDISREGITLRHSLLWPLDRAGKPLPVLPPPLAEHLSLAEERLRRRVDLVRGPWWQLFRVGPAASRWRVIWSDIARDLLPVAVDDPTPIPLNSCYVIPCRSEARMRSLALWLSTSWIRAIACLGAERAAGNHYRFGARIVGSLPCPEAVWTDPCFSSTAQYSVADREARAADLLSLDRRERASLSALTPPRR